jgi:hypothetical protein
MLAWVTVARRALISAPVGLRVTIAGLGLASCSSGTQRGPVGMAGDTASAAPTVGGGAAGAASVGGAGAPGSGGKGGSGAMAGGPATTGGPADGGAAAFAGERGAAGQATSGAGVGSDCADYSHWASSPRMRWDLRVVGTGFEAEQGKRVRAVVTLIGEGSYALAETTIRSGGFQLSLPGTIEPYTGIGVYIDRDGDDACSPDTDSMWQRVTSAVDGDHLWELTPQQTTPPDLPACNINGLFELAVPLVCPS